MVVANGDRGVVTGTARQRVYGRFIAETSSLMKDSESVRVAQMPCARPSP